MLSLASKDKEIKFLLDENVKKELLEFLKSKGYDVIFKAKGLTNGKLAEYSKIEQRVLVTNDRHFTDSSKFSKEDIFSIIWLKIPQDKVKLLLESFSKLLEEVPFNKFEGNLITLNENKFEIKPINQKHIKSS